MGKLKNFSLDLELFFSPLLSGEWWGDESVDAHKYLMARFSVTNFCRVSMSRKTTQKQIRDGGGISLRKSFNWKVCQAARRLRLDVLIKFSKRMKIFHSETICSTKFQRNWKLASSWLSGGGTLRVAPVLIHCKQLELCSLRRENLCKGLSTRFILEIYKLPSRIS